MSAAEEMKPLQGLRVCRSRDTVPANGASSVHCSYVGSNMQPRLDRIGDITRAAVTQLFMQLLNPQRRYRVAEFDFTTYDIAKPVVEAVQFMLSQTLTPTEIDTVRKKSVELWKRYVSMTGVAEWCGEGADGSTPEKLMMRWATDAQQLLESGTREDLAEAKTHMTLIQNTIKELQQQRGISGTPVSRTPAKQQRKRK